MERTPPAHHTGAARSSATGAPSAVRTRGEPLDRRIPLLGYVLLCSALLFSIWLLMAAFGRAAGAAEPSGEDTEQTVVATPKSAIHGPATPASSHPTGRQDNGHAQSSDAGGDSDDVIGAPVDAAGPLDEGDGGSPASPPGAVHQPAAPPGQPQARGDDQGAGNSDDSQGPGWGAGGVSADNPGRGKAEGDDSDSTGEDTPAADTTTEDATVATATDVAAAASAHLLGPAVSEPASASALPDSASAAPSSPSSPAAGLSLQARTISAADSGAGVGTRVRPLCDALSYPGSDPCATLGSPAGGELSAALAPLPSPLPAPAHQPLPGTPVCPVVGLSGSSGSSATPHAGAGCPAGVMSRSELFQLTLGSLERGSSTDAAVVSGAALPAVSPD